MKPMAEQETKNLDLERVARALADPKRFEILGLIAQSPEMSCAELIERVGLRQPTVSHHLKELAQAGLIETRREGTCIRFEVGRDAIEAYLSALRTRFLIS